MAERNLSVDHTAVWRWVQRYAPELNQRVRRELKQTGGSWRVDENLCCVLPLRRGARTVADGRPGAPQDRARAAAGHDAAAEQRRAARCGC